MQNEPGRRRFRGRRGRRQAVPRAQQAPAQPTLPARPAPRPSPVRASRQRRPRPFDELRPGTKCVVLVDCREGEPDRTGAAAVFDGYFDLETGESRHPDAGYPRLRVGDERLWGFECWWRVDPRGAGVTPVDHEELEVSKRLLRGLLRDVRRAGRPAVASGAIPMPAR